MILLNVMTRLTKLFCQLTVIFSELHGHHFILKTLISRKSFYYKKQNCRKKGITQENKMQINKIDKSPTLELSLTKIFFS